MNQSKYVKKLSKHEMRLIAKMRGKESPVKSIIQDIKDKLSKFGDKLVKKGLYYVEKMKELTESEVKNIKKN